MNAETGFKLREDIEPRNIHFGFDKSLPAYWHGGNPVISSYYDALSLTFPEGEKFFIDSVKNYAREIKDPILKRKVRAFTTQEAIHSREHDSYNALLAERGIPVHKFDRMIKAVTRLARKYLPHRGQLAATCGYEHFTALFAEHALADPRVIENAHPFYRDMWRWHAMEEEEHKAVAFDVYKAMNPGVRGYLVRCIAMVIVTLDFISMSTFLPMWILWHRGELFNMRGWAKSFWYHWVAPGVWRHVLMGIPGYFSPAFHPSKRKVKPQVLAWREHYLATQNRTADMPGSIFAPG
jgi:predicted metal-dependent hydrolase